MIPELLAHRVRGPALGIEYSFLFTGLTKHLEHSTLAELKLLCSVLPFDRWVESHEERDQIVRNIFVELGYVSELEAYRPKRIVIHEQSGEVLIQVAGKIGEENSCLRTQRNEQKLYKTLEAVETDLLAILQPDQGDRVVCAVTMRTLSRIPSRAETATRDKRKAEKFDPP